MENTATHDELKAALQEKIAACLKAFDFHFKIKKLSQNSYVEELEKFRHASKEGKAWIDAHEKLKKFEATNKNTNKK